MFSSIGRFAARRARPILVVTLLLLVAAGAFGFTAFDKLKSEGFADPAAESSQAQDLIDSRFGGQADLVFVVNAKSGTVDDPTARTTGGQLTEELAGDPALSQVVSYWSTNAPPMRSDDGRSALVLAHLADGDGDVADLRERYTGDEGPMTVRLGGGKAVLHDVPEQVATDLAVAEAIAVPVILLLLVIVFGSIVSALLPLAVGGIAILGTFAELSVLGSMTDVSVFAINLTTALGLGLAIDYALLSVYRFREELAAGRDVTAAVVRTVETAGRTIVFSGATVAVALAALLLFPLYFLRSFAYAGIGVVLIAIVSAIVVLPALLAVLGHRTNAGRLPWAKRAPSAESRFWARVATGVTRRPLLAAAPVLIVLIVAAVPLLRVDFGMPDDRVLPQSSPSRVVGDTLRSDFPNADTGAIEIVATGNVRQAPLADYAGRVSELPGVTHVSSSAGGFVDGRSAGSAPTDAALARPNAQRITVTTTADTHSATAQDLVGSIRQEAPPAGARIMVGGESAALVDSKASIGDRLPLAMALIAITTFVLLFLFSGSLLQPLRALLFNVLGLSATLGVLVWIFQEGALASLLGFTPMPLNTSMLMLLFCIVFGLSMDYEVFVLSRIKELRDGGASAMDAVVQGMSRTGRLVSMAAALLAVSFFAFVTSGVSFIQMFGLGSGLAILIDATLIRGVLVPAGIRMLGRWAWWAPKPLRRVHERAGLRDAPASPEEPKVPEPVR
ncbi:MAG: MMPL family transporter [Pseudonocardiaceae bacterium]|nr:MMPL family transporter [Pseudonocardiaceae bacterium]